MGVGGGGWVGDLRWNKPAVVVAVAAQVRTALALLVQVRKAGRRQRAGVRIAGVLGYCPANSTVLAGARGTSPRDAPCTAAPHTLLEPGAATAPKALARPPARPLRRAGAAPWSPSCGRAPPTRPPAPAAARKSSANKGGAELVRSKRLACLSMCSPKDAGTDICSACRRHAGGQARRLQVCLRHPGRGTPTAVADSPLAVAAGLAGAAPPGARSPAAAPAGRRTCSLVSGCRFSLYPISQKRGTCGSAIICHQRGCEAGPCTQTLCGVGHQLSVRAARVSQSSGAVCAPRSRGQQGLAQLGPAGCVASWARHPPSSTCRM